MIKTAEFSAVIASGMVAIAILAVFFKAMSTVAKGNIKTHLEIITSVLFVHLCIGIGFVAVVAIAAFIFLLLAPVFGI